MFALQHPLFTPRLRLEPVTRHVLVASSLGRTALSAAIDADIPQAWLGGYGLGPRGPDAPPRHVLVLRHADRRLIGEERFDVQTEEPDVFDVGYQIEPDCRRQGYAVEATSAVIDWLFDEGGAVRVIAGCDMGNLASVRTLRRLGFTLDGSSPRRHAFWWTLDS